jgi:hypothetical protein
MRKTDKLFKQYYRLFIEQTPEEQPVPGGEELPPMEPPDQQPEPAPQSKPMDENEKYIIKILTNAFIFNPKLFSGSRKAYIDKVLNTIKSSVNVPVASIIKEIKKIIAFDKSLYIESRTEFLLKRYFKILEQDQRDATEPQSDNQPDVEGDVDYEPQPEPENENDLDLVEIFPLYKELLMRALAHVPTEEELMMLKPVVNEFADVDPQKIVDLINNLLLKSPKSEDKSVADQLGKV